MNKINKMTDMRQKSTKHFLYGNEYGDIGERE